MKQISNVRFGSLIRLYLPGNKIQSIEVLCRIEMPDIKKLWLGDNKINEVSSLRKCHFKDLSRLLIRYHNYNSDNNPVK